MDIHILGTRGIPAKHGGFETFAEQLSLHLVSRGHSVTVYCQCGPAEQEFEDIWYGVRRIGLSESDRASGTIKFDMRSAWIASRHQKAILLTLGYNTALFSIIHRLRRVNHFMNMDGMEWQRKKWTPPQRMWLRANEMIGSILANHLIADHPHIKSHLERYVRPDKITVIPYGAEPVVTANAELIRPFGIEPKRYFLVIARPEPENSILEIVEAYRRSSSSIPLVILGHYLRSRPYHKAVLSAAANCSVIFPGAVYDRSVVTALRYHAAAYLHGHQVGGTNPSLVEALAAGNVIVAHGNVFNRWVCGTSAVYFSTSDELSDHINDVVLTLDKTNKQELSRLRHSACFTSEDVLDAYEQLLMGDKRPYDRWSLLNVFTGDVAGHQDVKLFTSDVA